MPGSKLTTGSVTGMTHFATPLHPRLTPNPRHAWRGNSAANCLTEIGNYMEHLQMVTKAKDGERIRAGIISRIRLQPVWTRVL